MQGLYNEAGGHRIQRIPPTERRGRVHTSTVTVAVVSEQTQTSPAALRAPEHFQLEWYSGSGAGGQHRNKHANSARVTHLPTGIVKSAQTRSRQNSKQNAMTALIAELDAMVTNNAEQQTNCTRKDQIGTGMRGDKRRTYRFQDNTVVDNVTNKRANACKVLEGHFDLLW